MVQIFFRGRILVRSEQSMKIFYLLAFSAALDTIAAETDGSKPLQINKSPLKYGIRLYLKIHTNKNTILNTNQNVECHISESENTK